MELRIEWTEDWDVGSHKKFFGPDSAYEDREPDTCEQCIVYGPHGEVLASLGCIDDADDAYRREIESELMDEAQWELGVADWQTTNVLCDY
jgi:hypothetical protein